MPVDAEQLRALSIRQLWAELILRGEKTVQYRSQATKVRGRVYIYASLAKPDPGYEQIERDLPRGLIVGTVEIADCENGDGDFEWILSNPPRLAEPIAPKEQAQPVWFYPFGRPEEEHAEIDETAVVNCDDSTTSSNVVRFLDRETCEKLLTIPATVTNEISVDGMIQLVLDHAIQSQVNRALIETQGRNEKFFDAESEKLDHWADDLKDNPERELKNIEVEIREANKAKRLAVDLQSKVTAQKRVNELEQQRNHKKRTLFDAQDQIEQRKDTLISEIEARLQQQTTREEVFTVRWRLS
jgi:hypothetical protein